MSFARVIRALLSGSVSLQLNFYRMLDQGGFPDEANYVARTSVQFSVSTGQVDIPAIRVADVDGDGLLDLAMQTGPGELTLRRGTLGESLFSDEDIRLTVALRRNGELVTVNDINLDGRADFAIRYNESDGDEAAKTVRLLISTM